MNAKSLIFVLISTDARICQILILVYVTLATKRLDQITKYVKVSFQRENIEMKHKHSFVHMVIVKVQKRLRPPKTNLEIEKMGDPLSLTF